MHNVICLKKLDFYFRTLFEAFSELAKMAAIPNLQN